MSHTLVVYYSRKGENYMPEGIRILETGHQVKDRFAEISAWAKEQIV